MRNESFSKIAKRCLEEQGVTATRLKRGYLLTFPDGAEQKMSTVNEIRKVILGDNIDEYDKNRSHKYKVTDGTTEFNNKFSDEWYDKIINAFPELHSFRYVYGGTDGVCPFHVIQAVNSSGATIRGVLFTDDGAKSVEWRKWNGVNYSLREYHKGSEWEPFKREVVWERI